MIENTLSPAVLSVLRQTPEILEKMLETAKDEQLDWKPSEDRWSISEVLGHLNHLEREMYRKRVQQFLDQVRDFDLHTYLPALFQGSRLDDATRREVARFIRLNVAGGVFLTA